MKRWLGMILAAALGIAVAVVCFTSVQIITVVGNGMLPSYEEGDMLLVNKIAYGGGLGASSISSTSGTSSTSRDSGTTSTSGGPRKGDVVVFPAKIYSADGEGRFLVKRVVATAGDRVAIGKGIVVVNDSPLEEPYIFAKGVGGDMKEATVKPGCVFVLGDNRGASLDSRNETVGQVKNEEITGRVVCRLWPWR